MAQYRYGLSIAGFTLALLIGLLTVGPTSANAQSESARITATVTPRDHAAAQNVTDHFCHIWPVGVGYGADTLTFPECQRHTSTPEAAAAKKGTEGAAAASGPFFFPGDVSYHGGPVVQSAQFFNLFLNSTCNPLSTCWGNPFQFQNDLFASSFIHITDQYVNATSAGRYQNGAFFVQIPAAEPHQMGILDVQAAVIASVRVLFPNGGGGGYQNVYNLFLPQGQDTCFNSSYCYSPDNTSIFHFCAYHASMNMTDAKGVPIHVLYTVEPYQNVPGCQVTNAPFPNGQLADSTNSTLSHEIFETITDPDGNAWWTSHQALFTNEIGDNCFAEPAQFGLNGKPYDVQLEYDNASHACNGNSSLFCSPSATTLCIDAQPGDGRFQIQAAYQTTQGGGSAGNGQAIPLSSLGVTQGGLMWFFEPNNPELLIKILPKCTESAHFWVFASAGTNVGVTMTVTDLKTSAQKAYTNPDLHPMTPVQDTAAFSCP